MQVPTGESTFPKDFWTSRRSHHTSTERSPESKQQHLNSSWTPWPHWFTLSFLTAQCFSSTISFCFHLLAYMSNLEYWSDVKHSTRIDLFFALQLRIRPLWFVKEATRLWQVCLPTATWLIFIPAIFFDILRILRSKHFSWPISHAHAFCRYQAYELIHARWAMLGAAGFVLPEAFNKFGAVCGPEAVWWKVCATS